ncbi:MAG TPA: hypothetical protein VL978_02320 [Puia sp.]|nr:hypothetical protein [Puia sp.]
MPDFDLTIDIYVLAALLVLAMVAGFLFRSRQLAKKKRQIGELEHEKMQAYAELLELQKDYCELEQKVKEEDSPVIPIMKKQDEAAGSGKTENF